MNLKSQKGFTGIDITVAVIIITLFMSIIATVFFNLNQTAKSLERKTEATYIAIDVIEKIKALDYNEIVQDIKAIKDIQEGAKKDGYLIDVKIEKYNNDTNNEIDDLVKTIIVKVDYKVGKNIENVELKTTVTREI